MGSPRWSTGFRLATSLGFTAGFRLAARFGFTAGLWFTTGLRLATSLRFASPRLRFARLRFASLRFALCGGLELGQRLLLLLHGGLQVTLLQFLCSLVGGRCGILQA